jgi:cytochrome c-type biogenesis protein CcmI
MIFWVITASACALVVSVLIRPLYAGGKLSASMGMQAAEQLYLQQQQELAQSHALGELGTAEWQRLNAQISRRLSALSQMPALSLTPQTKFAKGLALAVPLFVLGLYALKGRPDLAHIPPLSTGAALSPSSPALDSSGNRGILPGASGQASAPLSQIFPGQEAASGQESLPSGQDGPLFAQQAAIRAMVAGLAARLNADPSDWGGWQRLIQAYKVLGDKEAERQSLERALSYHPSQPELVQKYAQYWRLAAPALQAPLPIPARLAYQRLLTLVPTNAEALWQLGRDAALNGQRALAQKYWQSLKGLMPLGSQEAELLEEALKSLEG